MDDPSLDAREHREALRGLARLNVLAGVARRTWNGLEPLARAIAPRPLRVLELASGGGDGAIALWKRARARGHDVRVTGLDIGATAVLHARDAARRAGASGVEFHAADVLAAPIPRDADAIVCSLFLHHLRDEDVVALLSACRSATPRRIVMHDLERTSFGELLARVVPPLVTRSPVVRTDAVLSVRAAFRRDELAALAARARLAGARITRCFPERLELSWSAA